MFFFTYASYAQIQRIEETQIEIEIVCGATQPHLEQTLIGNGILIYD